VFHIKISKGGAHNAHRGGWTGLNFAYSVIIEIRMKK